MVCLRSYYLLVRRGPSLLRTSSAIFGPNRPSCIRLSFKSVRRDSMVAHLSRRPLPPRIRPFPSTSSASFSCASGDSPSATDAYSYMRDRSCPYAPQGRSSRRNIRRGSTHWAWRCPKLFDRRAAERTFESADRRARRRALRRDRRRAPRRARPESGLGGASYCSPSTSVRKRRGARL